MQNKAYVLLRLLAFDICPSYWYVQSWIQRGCGGIATTLYQTILQENWGM